MSPDLYEDMVSCLLSNLNPKTLRIDGTGGDGGRDVQYETSDGLHIYELKSFTGRMKSSRRTQVELSLVKAAEHKPIRWDLVVPIDPTIGELKWFDGLQGKYSFPIGWSGKTWLDAQMIEHPSIWRHFREGAHAEVVELLRELHEEDAGLERGMPDVIERANKLIGRANELDPHYVFGLEIDGARTKVSIIPRYVGALEDRPITTQIEFRFDTNTPEGNAKFEEFKLANDFGVPMDIGTEFISKVEVDAPAGLGGTFTEVHLSMGAGHSPAARPLDFEFVAVSEAGDVVERLALTLAPESVGKKGVIMTGRDRSGLFEARLLFGTEPTDGNTKLNLASGPFVPHELLGAARLLAALHAPNVLSVRTTDGTLSSQPIRCPAEPPVDPVFAQFVADLAMVQAATGMVQEVAGEFELSDFATAAAGAALIRGEEAQQPWKSLTLSWEESPKGEDRRKLAEEPVPFVTDLDGPAVVRVCGVEYPIGRKRRVQVLGRVEPNVARQLLDGDTEITKVVLRPEPGTFLKIRITER